MQIDDLLDKLNNASGDLERLRDEKDQEIMILQAGMDSTIEKLSEVQQVRYWCLLVKPTDNRSRTKISWTRRLQHRSTI